MEAIIIQNSTGQVLQTAPVKLSVDVNGDAAHFSFNKPIGNTETEMIQQYSQITSMGGLDFSNAKIQTNSKPTIVKKELEMFVLGGKNASSRWLSQSDKENK